MRRAGGLKANLFLIEDERADCILMERLCEQCYVPVQVYTHHGGEDTPLFLARRGEYVHLPVPDIFLIDYNLPRHHYASLVATIRALPEVADRMIVLYSSALPNPALGVSSTYAEAMRQLGPVDAFVLKPLELHTLDSLVATALEKNRRGARHSYDYRDLLNV